MSPRTADASRCATAPIVYLGLGVDRRSSGVPQLISGLTLQPDKPVVIAGKELQRLHVMINNLDETMAPAGSSVLNSLIDSDYKYWKELKEDSTRYKSEKDRVARFVTSVLEKRFPGLGGKVETIDVATPLTFERYTGNRLGCYEGSFTTPKTQMMRIKKTCPGSMGSSDNLHAKIFVSSTETYPLRLGYYVHT